MWYRIATLTHQRSTRTRGKGLQPDSMTGSWLSRSLCYSPNPYVLPLVAYLMFFHLAAEIELQYLPEIPSFSWKSELSILNRGRPLLHINRPRTTSLAGKAFKLHIISFKNAASQHGAAAFVAVVATNFFFDPIGREHARPLCTSSGDSSSAPTARSATQPSCSFTDIRRSNIQQKWFQKPIHAADE